MSEEPYPRATRNHYPRDEDAQQGGSQDQLSNRIHGDYQGLLPAFGST